MVGKKRFTDEERYENLKESQKKYLERNRERKKGYLNEYYEKRKTEILEKLKNREKLFCKCCNNSYYKSDMERHNKTRKHLYNDLLSKTSLTVIFDE